MMGCRLRYLAVLAAAVLYYIGNGTWLSWMVLMVCLGLPWLSLLLSLPAILTVRIQPTGLPITRMGQEERLWILGSCKFPMPPFRGGIVLEKVFTGEKIRYSPAKGVDTCHCGGYIVRTEGVRAADYLGLFAFRVKAGGAFSLCIRPLPIPAEQVPPEDEAISFRPQPSGFSETQELRPYRPGDSLNRIHWKLSAKTGNLILREPVKPLQKPPVLTLTLSGTPEALDIMLGRLLAEGTELLARSIPFFLRPTTGLGTSTLLISTEAEFHRAIDALLLSPAVTVNDR